MRLILIGGKSLTQLAREADGDIKVLLQRLLGIVVCMGIVVAVKTMGPERVLLWALKASCRR